MSAKPPSAQIATLAAQVALQANQQDLPDVELQDGEEKGRCANRTLTTRIAQGVAGASIVLNIVAIAIEQSAVMIIAGLVALIIAPIVILQQFQLQDVGSMREVQNKLRKNVNDLQKENNKLAAENTLLEGEVSKLQETEARLERITAEQGSNIHQLVELVKENKEIQTKMKSAVEAETVQSLVSAILDSDMNADSTFSDREINILSLRLKNLPGIKVNEAALKRSMSTKSASIKGILELVKNMEKENSALPEEDRVFAFSD